MKIFNALCLLLSACHPLFADVFELKTEDRIVLLGGTIIEREQKFGFLETQLHLAAGPAKITVRNLGWSGDTVFGTARSYFGPPGEGMERLGGHLALLKPSVLLVCYGHDVALDSDASIPDFITGYDALLKLAREKSPDVRIIVVAPPPFENLGTPLPNMDAANKKLASVCDALKEFAARQKAAFVDTFHLMMFDVEQMGRKQPPLTDNGVHYGESGYRRWSAAMLKGLGLASPAIPAAALESLRKEVIKKDFLFFNRWRPANETYIFGFRKQEQGRNAAEIPQFDPLVDAREKKIHELKNSILNASRVP